MLLVGVPALIELPTARLLAALSISVIFLVVQHERKPYATAENNALASLAAAQITATLLFICIQSTVSVPRVLGFLCIFLNVVLVPLTLWFNARRIKRRRAVLSTLVFRTSFKLKKKSTTNKISTLATMSAKQTSFKSIVSVFFDPSHFSEYWKAGTSSEYELFCATLEWINFALQRPVTVDCWGQILYTLEQLPLTSSANADVRHGLMLDTSDASTITLGKFDVAFGFSPGERWFGYVSCDEHFSNERVRSGTFEGELVLISKRTLPTRKVRVDSQIQEITLLDVNGDGTNMTLTIPYKVRGDRGDQYCCAKFIVCALLLTTNRQHYGLLSKLWRGRFVRKNGSH